ncbi:hypothetical protein [Geodermatophilus sp. URMC 63]
MSRNDSFTGVRAMRSARHHRLAMTRAILCRTGRRSGSSRGCRCSSCSRLIRGRPRGGQPGIPTGQVLHSSAVTDDDDDLRMVLTSTVCSQTTSPSASCRRAAQRLPQA